MQAPRVGALGLVLTLATVGLAGCVETDLDPNALDDANEATDAVPELPVFTGSDCWEGGFVALYPRTPKHADTWQTIDIRDEVGNPMRDGTGLPLNQDAYGNWHEGIQCSSVTYNGQTFEAFKFGFVGNMIAPPAFDPGGADLHFIVSAIGLDHGAVHEEFRATSLAGISATETAHIDYLVGDRSLPRFVVYEEFSTHDNGVYSSYSEMAEYRDVEPRTIRFWWTVPTDGTQSPLGSHHADHIPEDLKWNPVYFDLKTEAGAQYTTPPVDSVEVACHTGIDDHGPQGGACQPTLTLIYEHSSLSFEFGGVLRDVVIDDYWHH
jgi:hypothetical protein